MELSGVLALGGETLRLSLTPAQADPALPGDWQALAAQGAPSVFLSWPWIEAFLAGLPAEGFAPFALRFCRNEAVIALAIVTAAPAAQSGARWVFNESGDPGADAATLEYNGLVAAPSAPAGLMAALVAWLGRVPPAPRRLHFGGLEEPAADEIRAAAAALGWLVRPLQAQTTFWRDLQPFGGDPGGLVHALSRNTRAAIQRAERLYAETAPLSWETADTLETALQRFAEMEGLHTAQWRARGRPGAFGQPGFRAFHERLIRSGFDRGMIRLHRLRHGDRTLGILYNLAWNGTVYAYQSGFAFDADNRRKPGYVAHARAMAAAIAEGARRYDFCAGETQLKRSLASHSGPMTWLALSPPTPLNRLIAWARNAKKRWRGGAAA